MADVINPAYLSMPAQVQKNKDDIEALRNSMFLADPEGQYSSDKTYGKGALVAYTDGNIYYHFSETETQGVPPTNAETWIMYQEGIKGTPGTNGSNGYPIYLVTSNYAPTSPRAYKRSIKTPAGYPDPISGSIVYFQNGYLATLETDSGDYWTLNTSVVNLNGQTGAAGADGLPALTYGGTASASATPVQGNTLQFVNTSFNRTPEAGDRFISFVAYSTSNYICGMRVTGVGPTNTGAVIETVLQVASEFTRKYMHYISFQTVDANSPVAYITCMLITTSSAAITDANTLKSALSSVSQTIGRIMATGVRQISSGPPANGYIAYINMPSSEEMRVYYYGPSANGLSYSSYPSTGTLNFNNINDVVVPLV